VRCLLIFEGDDLLMKVIALHNAADKGHTRVLELLLETDCDVNAQLSNGMTPIHWAAFNGHEEAVKLILSKTDHTGRPEADLALKDTFDRTPMLCAAENYHAEIVQLLQPGKIGYRVPRALRRAMEGFDATVVDFGGEGGAFRDGKKQLHFKYSVYDLLYGWNVDTDKPKVPTQVKNIKHQPAFRWIHLPANNVKTISPRSVFLTNTECIDCMGRNTTRQIIHRRRPQRS